MSNIEDDANVLGAFCLAGRIEIISPEEFEEVKIAISNILSEREQDKARIKELEEENASKQKAYDDCYCEYKHYKQFDSIPKQKVKDKIEEVKLSGGGNGKDNVENLARELVIDVLEELLEEGE